RHRLQTVPGAPDDLNPLVRGQNRLQSLCEQRVVVGDQDADLFCHLREEKLIFPSRKWKGTKPARRSRSCSSPATTGSSRASTRRRFGRASSRRSRSRARPGSRSRSGRSSRSGSRISSGLLEERVDLLRLKPDIVRGGRSERGLVRVRQRGGESQTALE